MNATLAFVLDVIEDLKNSIRNDETVGFVAKQYALNHCEEIVTQLQYIHLALENK